MTDEKFKKLFVFTDNFKQIYDKEEANLLYHINLIDELHANENAHSRILEKLLNQKTPHGQFELLESFVEYLKEKGKNKEVFSKIKIEEPIISQETERIDLWIRDKSYAIIIENKSNWAGDQQAQIERYIDKTKSYGFSEKDIFVIYLPPTHEKELEQQSWGKYFEKDIYNQRYLVLSFRDDIIAWLKEKVLPNIKLKDVYLRSAIEQYIDHLEGIFSLRTINNKRNMELEKFIKKELELSDNNCQESLDKLSSKKEELRKAINQIDMVAEQYRKNSYETQKARISSLLEKVKECTNDDWEVYPIKNVREILYFKNFNKGTELPKISLVSNYELKGNNPLAGFEITIEVDKRDFNNCYKQILEKKYPKKIEFDNSSIIVHLDVIENDNEKEILEKLQLRYKEVKKIVAELSE